ncbi:hypothetical protein D3C78_910330 [compost metagenome]
MRLSEDAAPVRLMVKLSPLAGVAPTVVCTVKVFCTAGVTLLSITGAPLASTMPTFRFRVLLWPGTMVPVPIELPLASTML